MAPCSGRPCGLIIIINSPPPTCIPAFICYAISSAVVLFPSVMLRGSTFHRYLHRPPSPSTTNVLPIKTMDAYYKKRNKTVFPTPRHILAIVSLFIVSFFLSRVLYHSSTPGQHRTWHGGHPAADRTGSCWCGDEDGYCMCTPALSVDIVLYEKRDEGYSVWAVRRKDTGQLGTIGG